VAAAKNAKTSVAVVQMLLTKNIADSGISDALQVHLKCLEDDIIHLDHTVIRLRAQ